MWEKLLGNCVTKRMLRRRYNPGKNDKVNDSNNGTVRMTQTLLGNYQDK